IIVVQFCECLTNIEESAVLLLKLIFKREKLSLAYHALGDCFSPYIAFFNLHANVGSDAFLCPGGRVMYTSSSNVPWRNAFFTSIWNKFHPKLVATDSKILMVFIFATGAKVSW